jgi:exosortase
MNLLSRNKLFICFSLSLLFLMAKPIRGLVEFALDPENTAASQIVLIPFISATLIYWNRKNIFQSVKYSVFSGAVVSVLGFGLLIAGSTFGTRFAEDDRLALITSSFVIVWLGGFLFFYGTDAFRRARFPLLFLALCVPIPTPVLHRTIVALQHASAETALVLLKLTGTPVYREGFVLAMPGLTIDVAPECSGIRSSIGVFILTLLAGYFVLRSWWKRAVLVMAAMPIVILKNAIRIDTLSLLTLHVDRRIINSRLHHDGGFIFFFLGLLLLYPVLVMLMKSEGKPVVRSELYRLGSPPTLEREHPEGNFTL